MRNMTTVSDDSARQPEPDPEIRVIADIARVNASRYPEAEAVVHAGRRLTWSQLDARVVQLANALRDELDVEPGARVSAIAENCLEYFEFYHGTAVAGVIAVPLNQRLALEELADIAERVDPKVLFHDAAHLEQAESLRDRLGCRLVPIGDAMSDSASTTYDSLLAAASTNRPQYRPEPGDPATICFTGGTTGLPKGCVISHGALIEFGRMIQLAQGVRLHDRHLFVRPMAVAPGHRMVSWHGVTAGCTVIANRFEAGEFYRMVEQERCTNTLLSPTMFQMLLDHGNPEGYVVGSLRSVGYGGAPITPDLLAQVVEVFGCELHQNYGGSEAASATHLTPADHQAGRLDSIGRALPGIDVEVVDADGNVLPPGGAGEIIVRGSQLFSRYWGNENATNEVLRDGYYWTGDLATRDAEGYLRLVGRTKDLIISGGYNVYPIEVENALAEHPAVRDVAVIGIPDRKWGEAVHAVIVLADGQTPDADGLVEHCRSRIASYKKPRSIEFVDELPRTTVGKIAKNVLRDRHAALDGQQSGPR